MPNLYQQLRELLTPGQVQIASVVSVTGGVAVLELPGGGRTRARGDATVGTKVFVMDGVIQGPAPNLPVVVDVI